MAITVTPADIISTFPEFGDVPPVTIQRWIDEAICNVNEAQWAKRANSGVEFLTAHYLATFGPGAEEASAGPVTSEREGQVQAAYAVAGMFSQDALGTTKYGRQFLTLRKRIFVTRKI